MSMAVFWRRFFGSWILGPSVALCLAASMAMAASGEQWVKARWVADGDTIVLEDGRHVRYIGIDTPEMEHKQQHGEPIADWARKINEKLVKGARLRLAFDEEQRDRYGRTLAYVYLENGLFVNAEMVKQGCANVLCQSPNVKMAKTLLAAQREAMTSGVGIWKYVDRYEQPPHSYRGNRNSKRFHAYDCPKGKRMSPRNQVWLKNKWEAFWQGYSPARGCIVFP